MAQQTLILNISDDLYHRLKQRAEAAHRSVEAEVVNTLSASVAADAGRRTDLAELLDALAQMDDEALRQASRNTLAREADEGLRQLRARRTQEQLTAEELERQTELLRQYDRGLLIRSQALALLKQRGRNIDALPT